MDTSKIASRVAFLVLAKDYFIIKDPLAELKGDTLDASDLRQYEGALEKVTEEYVAKLKELDGQRTPGMSNPKAAIVGRELQVLRRKGSKARARVEVAKWLKKQGILTMYFSGEASGEMLVLKNPQDVLEGEVIEATLLPKYEAAARAAEAEYAAQKAANADLTGKARGEGGQALAKLGEAKRKAQARLDVARQMKKSGVARVQY